MSEPVIMYGKEVADNMLKDFKARESSCLYIFSNQADPASKVYVNNKKKKCEELGVPCIVYDISNATIGEIKGYFADIKIFNWNKFYNPYIIIHEMRTIAIDKLYDIYDRLIDEGKLEDDPDLNEKAIAYACLANLDRSDDTDLKDYNYITYFLSLFDYNFIVYCFS